MNATLGTRLGENDWIIPFLAPIRAENYQVDPALQSGYPCLELAGLNTLLISPGKPFLVVHKG